jgi:hypothetical protein
MMTATHERSIAVLTNAAPTKFCAEAMSVVMREMTEPTRWRSKKLRLIRCRWRYRAWRRSKIIRWPARPARYERQ